MECHLLTKKVYTVKSDTKINVQHYEEFKVELSIYCMLIVIYYCCILFDFYEKTFPEVQILWACIC